MRLAGFAGLLAWRFYQRVLPAASLCKRFATVSCAVLLPPYSRAAATACLRPLAISAAHRLPVHEACGYCRGRFRPLWVIRSRALRCGGGPKLRMQAPAAIHFFPAHSLAAAHSLAVRPRAASGKPVPADPAGRRLQECRLAGTFPFASAQLDLRIRRRDSVHA